jgi:predicted Zn-dependent protease
MGGWIGTGAAGNDDRALIVPAGFLKIQRENELDADRVAVKIMAAAGFDPAALIEYIRRTQRALAAKSEKYSVLPPREERISALETAAASLPSRTGRPGDEFKAIQDRVRELTAEKMPSSPKEPPSLRRKDGR